MAPILKTLLIMPFLGLTQAGSVSGCGKQPANINATSSFNVTSSSTSRNFLVHVPSGYDNNHQYPVVLAFSGNTETAEEMELDTRLSDPNWSPDVNFPLIVVAVLLCISRRASMLTLSECTA